MSEIYPYAGFWKRLGAFVIDSFIIAIPLMVGYGIWFMVSLQPMVSAMAASPAGASAPDMMPYVLRLYSGMFGFQIISLLIFWLYYSIMESSRYQATLGKMALGIKVVGAQGQRITFWHATGRTLSKWISAMILYIGFLMAGANKHKQALHDIIASTYVVNKNYQEGEALPEVQTHYVLLGLSIAAVIAAFILPFILLMAVALSEATRGTSANNTPHLTQAMHDAVAVSRIKSLKQLPKEEQQPFTENEYAYSFLDDGTVRAQREGDASYAFIMKPDALWPCCQPLVPDGCASVLNTDVCQTI